MDVSNLYVGSENGLGWSDALSVRETSGSSISTLHEGIFEQPSHLLFYSHDFKGALVAPAATDKKISKISADRCILPTPKADVSIEGGAEYTWGGKDDGWSGYISGEASDKDGNYVEGEIRQNSDGSGSARGSAGTRR